MLKKHFICFTCLMAVLLLPFRAFSRGAEAGEAAEDGRRPVYMGSVSVGTYGMLAVPFLGPYIGPTAVSVFTSHGVYFPDAGVYTGISLELMNLDYGLAYTLHTKYYFKSKKIAKPFIGVEAGGFSEFSALKDNRPATPYSEQKVYFYAAPSVGIANCFKKVTFEISVRTLIIPGITVERGSWHSGIGVVLGLAF